MSNENYRYSVKTAKGERVNGKVFDPDHYGGEMRPYDESSLQEAQLVATEAARQTDAVVTVCREDGTVASTHRP